MIISLLSGHRPNDTKKRVPINIRPAVRERLRLLLYQPELRGVGYSSFIERAIEVAETEIAEHRRTGMTQRTKYRVVFGDQEYTRTSENEYLYASYKRGSFFDNAVAFHKTREAAVRRGGHNIKPVEVV